MTTLPTRITLPPSGRPVGGLLSAARDIPAGDWWRGVTFSSGQCLVPQTVGTCTDGEVSKTLQDLSDVASFDAFSVLQALRCTTMGQSELGPYVNASLDVTREFAVARELLTGTASGNPSLADATTLNSASITDAESALACLDQHAATELSGRLAFIHASPLLAVHLYNVGMFQDGRLWRTPLGNIVVVSAGYDGRAPATPSVAPSEGDPQYLYATGEVYAEVGQRETLNAVERGQNSLQAIAEDAAIAVFDPCFNVAVATDIDFCELTASS